MITMSLNAEATEPLYQQLYRHIKSEIISGRLMTKDKLPSIRQLSSHLKCSQNTIKTAYMQLSAEGYIQAKPKSGYYVCQVEGILTINRDSTPHSKEKNSHTRYTCDFSHRGVDLESFPFSTWRKITKEVINEYDLDLLKIGSFAGNLNLRSSIASYLRQSRGVDCSADQIIISSGTEFLLQLLLQLFDETRTYAIENPGYEKLNLIFESNRVKYKAVPLDESGMSIQQLIQNRADIAYVTPSHQFPTGNIMPVNRRIQLINWANEAEARYIIEDDYDSEFKYYGKPIPSLQGLDKGGKVIYMGAFSKSLTPGLRISYMVLPKQLMDVYLKKLSFYFCPVPIIEQKVLCRFIDEGHFERHLNRMRNIYREKREILVSCINELLPHTKIRGADVGLHLLLEVSNGMNEVELIESAKQHSVRVFGCSQYYFNKEVTAVPPTLLLGFATLKTKDIRKAIEALKRAWY